MNVFGCNNNYTGSVTNYYVTIAERQVVGCVSRSQGWCSQASQATSHPFSTLKQLSYWGGWSRWWFKVPTNGLKNLKGWYRTYLQYNVSKYRINPVSLFFDRIELVFIFKLPIGVPIVICFCHFLFQITAWRWSCVSGRMNATRRPATWRAYHGCWRRPAKSRPIWNPRKSILSSFVCSPASVVTARWTTSSTCWRNTTSSNCCSVKGWKRFANLPVPSIVGIFWSQLACCGAIWCAPVPVRGRRDRTFPIGQPNFIHFSVTGAKPQGGSTGVPQEISS